LNYDDDILDLRIMTKGRTTYKARCNLGNKKGLEEVINVLRIKFNVDLGKLANSKKRKIEEDWF